MRTVEDLEDRLTTPGPRLVASMRRIEGDMSILGAGGKMGPTLSRLAARGAQAAGVEKRIIGVSRFSDPSVRERLESYGVETIQSDLLEPGAIEHLPETPNVIFMVGRKFGSTGAEWATWSNNVFLAGLVGRRFRKSRIVAFSSGNIYPFVGVDSGGATEATPAAPVGEYAMSCLGRERLFDYAANELGARVLHLRLNYAVELRYGVIADVANLVWQEMPVDLKMGHVNVIWQGYANSVALQCLELAASPPAILNVSGRETVSIRRVAERLGELMGRRPRFENEEARTALLSNAGRCHERFGEPDVDLDTVVQWIAHWTMHGGESLDKPTHFQVRNGRF
ncbi:MAG TPA: NAD(P)-dependent oxidoreductase [Candidatus Hydrogenedentes bacterium]|nr:NAD(P)-dependent oxidoreductase [Candidatus Hydrogenedentota bacterium]